MVPMDIAKLLLESRTPPDGLRYWRGHFYGFDPARGCYQKINEQDFDAEFGQTLHDMSPHLTDPEGLYFNTRYIREETRKSIQWQANVKSTARPPCWVQDPPQGRRIGERCNSYVAFQNGILDVDAYFRTGEGLFASTPTFFSTTARDFEFKPDARCPAFAGYLSAFTMGDEVKARALQEWAGLCQIHETKYQKFCVLVGDGANGKGVFAEVLRKLVGDGNHSNLSLGQLAGRFAYSSLTDRLINISDELDEADRADEARLKTLSGGEPVNVEQKYRDAVEQVPSVRLMFLTNALPHIRDRSEGFWRRLILIPCRQVLKDEDQDRDLRERLGQELPGIFNWALEGLRRLREQDGFTEAADSRDAVAEYRRGCNPLREFLDDTFSSVPPGIDVPAVTYPAVVQAFKVWAAGYGMNAKYSARSMGDEMKRHFRDLQIQQRGAAGNRVRVYVGIAFQSDVEGARRLQAAGTAATGQAS